ncbi:MAG: hypothetical protein IJY67_10310 [Paludibacteraceae bacterium]|nr:hypothetical protein [Paludibacteraceae bacterium]
MKKNLLKVAALFFAVFVSVSAMAQLTTLQPVTQDQSKYDSVGYYKLVNDWIRSNTLGNFNTDGAGLDLSAANKMVRGMSAYKGKMYFAERVEMGKHRIIVIDGATGNFEKYINLAENVFTCTENEGTDSAKIVSAGALPNNDLKFDDAGNCIVSNCITSALGRYQVWVVNLETGAGELLIDDVMEDFFPGASIRFDYVGVCGDVKGDAIVLAGNQLAKDVFRWDIVDGVASDPVQLFLDPLFEGDEAATAGACPLAKPIKDTELFYLDGNGTVPTLYAMSVEEEEATRVDCFYDSEGKALPLLSEIGGSGKVEGNNGLCDFVLEYENGVVEYFMVFATGNQANTQCPHGFAIMKYADENLSFQTAELIYQFPQGGFGTQSMDYRSAPVYVEAEGTTAAIYCYVGQNGIAKYTFTSEGTPTTTVGVENVIVDNIYTEGGFVVAEGEFQIFTVTGQNVTAQNGNLAQGAYIVKTANTVTKVFVK